MCVRYAGFALQTDSLEDPSASGDRFPGDEGSFVVEGGEIVVGRWGLQPAWAKDERFGRRNAYNARAETVAEKPTFRVAFRQRRCLVPLGAFYERAVGRWLRVSPAGDGPFLVAGLWEAPNERTHGLPTYTMVTTEPNLAIADLHDRMPVILAAEDAGDWTDPEADPRRLHALLLPCPPEWTRVADAGPVGRPKSKSDGATLF